MVGDVVRIHYTCSLQEGGGGGGGRSSRGINSKNGADGIVVENSRKNRRRPLEFVVGTGQVVKGIDRSVRTMLYGERAKVCVTAAYAYGDEGHPPVIPPGAALVFDVNLLDFWPRPRWQKPLVQVLSEPYAETPYAPRSKLLAAAVDVASGKGSGDSNEESKSTEGSRGRHEQQIVAYGKVGRY